MTDIDPRSDEEAKAQLDTALTVAAAALRFGEVERATRHPDGRGESDSTHACMVGLLAIELAPKWMDLGKLLEASLAHDLVEIYADDTCTAWGLSSEEQAMKSAREFAAIERLRDDGLPKIVEAIESYERQDTPEARWVRYIDKICPKLTHLLNGGSALRIIGMTRENMLRRHEELGRSLTEQYPEQYQARALFEAACERCESELLLPGTGGDDDR